MPRAAVWGLLVTTALHVVTFRAEWNPFAAPPEIKQRRGHPLVGFVNPDNQFDADRFLEQAVGIMEGRGPEFEGRIDLSLPPGYPFFLACLLTLGASEGVIRVLQVGLSIASCWLVYLAMRPYSERWAVRGLWVLGTCPWLVQRAGMLMSEVLGVFVCACFVVSYSFAERRATALSAFCLGVIGASLPLVSPFAVFLAGSLLAYFVLSNLRKPALSAAVVAGGLTVVIPWGVYARYVIAHQQGTIKAVRNATDDNWSDFQNFIKESALCENDLRMHWLGHSENFNLEWVPDRAFSSAEEQRAAQDKIDEFLAGRLAEEEIQAHFRQLRRERNIRRFWEFKVLYPAIRGVNLWVDMHYPFKLARARRNDLPWGASWSERHASQPRPPATSPFGQGGTAKALYSAFFQLWYASYFIGFLAIVAVATWFGRMTPLAVLTGVLMYSAFSGITCLPEGRRNLVFFPAMTFAAAYVPAPIRQSVSGRSATCNGRIRTMLSD